jgi:hypothetical protein
MALSGDGLTSPNGILAIDLGAPNVAELVHTRSPAIPIGEPLSLWLL